MKRPKNSTLVLFSVFFHHYYMHLPAVAAVIVIIISAFLIYKNSPLNEAQPTSDKGFQANLVTQTPEPSQSPVPSSISSAKNTPKPSIKGSSSPNPTSASSSSTPSSTPISSPTPKPSPTPGVYTLYPSPTQDVKLRLSVYSGYAVTARIKDSNGDEVSNLGDFSFNWVLADPNLVTGKASGNSYTINYNQSAGSTKLKVTATYNPTGKTIGETEFNITVEN